MTNTPNKRAIRKWVNALRSGEFKQGTGQLSISTYGGRVVRHCCLGVACEIVPKNRKVKKTILDHRDTILYHSDTIMYDGESTWLPESVRKWLGLRNNPFVKDLDNKFTDKQIDLVHANDSRHWDFNKIADALEETYLK